MMSHKLVITTNLYCNFTEWIYSLLTNSATIFVVDGKTSTDTISNIGTS